MKRIKLYGTFAEGKERIPLIESFRLFESEEASLEKVLTAFNAAIEIASKDEHDIESAYEEVIASYKQQFPQFSKEIDAEFERVSKEEEKRINDLK